MCKALEEIAEMARQEGVEQGKKAGEKEGFEQGLLLAKQVIRLAKEGHSVEEMAETVSYTHLCSHDLHAFYYRSGGIGHAFKIWKAS